MTPIADGLRKGFALLLANGAKPGAVYMTETNYTALCGEGVVSEEPEDEYPRLDGWEIWVSPDARPERLYWSMTSSYARPE